LLFCSSRWNGDVHSRAFALNGRRVPIHRTVAHLFGIYFLVLPTLSNISLVSFIFIFLQLNFFAAIQDIAVDGWALTILSRFNFFHIIFIFHDLFCITSYLCVVLRKNVGYASTCNAVGQTTGYFLGNVVFLSLESADFANTFIRSADNQKTYGIIDLAGKLLICKLVHAFIFPTITILFQGFVFIISTTLVLIFKKEVDNLLESSPANGENDEKVLELGIVETYSVLWKILKLKPMMYMLVILSTGKDRKVDGWTTLFIGGIFAALVYFTPSFRLDTGKFSNMVYIVWIIGYIFGTAVLGTYD
uniref:Acetyl-coenzyme A transporter 1 (inferred by orthology to a human protein) n=1 Tax=Nippostrongylus brasiliensis TaxID=27835 RepID=A0A0N4XXH4_NIPBR